MSVWIILVVAGILLVAALVLIIAVHVLDLYTEQQCVQLQALTQRSLQKNEDGTHFQYRRGESQLCCVCGTVRKRRLQVNDESFGLTTIGSEDSPAGGFFHPLFQAACGKTPRTSTSLDFLSDFYKRKRIATGYHGSWFDVWGFFRRLQSSRSKGRGVEENHPQIRAVETAHRWDSDSSALTPELVPLTQVGQGSSTLGPDIPSGANITASREPLDSSLTNTASSSALKSCEADGAQKQAPPRRLVLEIIMSPSPREGQGSGLPRATGVRLRVDTDANLDDLANLPIPPGESAIPGRHELGLESGDSLSSTIVSDGHVLTYEFSAGLDGTSGAVDGRTGPDMKRWEEGFVASSTGQSNRCSGLPHERDAPCMLGLGDKKCPTSEDSKTSIDALGGSAIGAKSPDQGSASLRAVGPDSSFTPFKARLSRSASAGHSSAKAKAKAECSYSSSSTGNESPGTSCGTSLSTLKSTQGQHSSCAAVDGLGSLRISSLDDVAKGNVTKDCSKGVTVQIASALAALKVDSIGGNSVGIGGESASGIEPDSSDSFSASEQGDAAREEPVCGEGSESKNREEGKASIRGTQELDDYEDVCKKGKSSKKKKNRGRRNKAKTAAGAVAAAILEAQENSHGRHWTRITAEAAPSQGEVEFGCICGTSKGGCHSTACPYPFTPSGSMVQRKIKEQYDDLVRSNVARTLTLAQVGRFTTCLVEAKSALQQKSDTIQRRFTIAKSLLSKADKSSFDRLCGQMYGLEIEQKKLEEDTIVYNRLQEQLKLSPAYQKMLEYGRAHFELQPNTGQLIEKVETEDAEISFEELLAREKKDSFWQKHGTSRSSMPLSSFQL